MNKILLLIMLCLLSSVIYPMDRPMNWAVPIALKGVPNFYKVSDTLYRGAQPTAEGIKNLKKLGIKTIINLRTFHSDIDKIINTGLNYKRIYFKTWHPEKEDVIRFLKIVKNPKNTPVFVHCMHGSDRTGMMCAAYRIVIQSWTKAEAVTEMKNGGFGFHRIWIDIPLWIKLMNVNEFIQEINRRYPYRGYP